jgi:hypothetical protein
MSSDLFHVEVLEISGTSVLVEVTDTYHGISAPETETFFFAALYEPAGDDPFPITQACSMDEICDEEFVEANIRKYVERVEVIEASSRAKATYRVHFTDAKWAEHLRRGLAWGTASYDIGEPVLRPALEALTGQSPPTPKRGVD